MRKFGVLPKWAWCNRRARKAWFRWVKQYGMAAEKNGKEIHLIFRHHERGGSY